MDLPVGARVRVWTCLNETVEGTVYTVDHTTGMLVLQCTPVPPVGGNCSMRMVNAGHLTATEVLEAPADGGALGPHGRISSAKELERKEAKAMRDAERALSQINFNASGEAQAIFDALARTMDCEWLGLSIVIYDQVQIDPPYAPAQCVRLHGCPAGALERVQKVLEGERRKLVQLAKRDSASSAAAAGEAAREHRSSSSSSSAPVAAVKQPLEQPQSLPPPQQQQQQRAAEGKRKSGHRKG
ncbi:anticodon-binding domain-containing protein [Tribonema minus]|uniref:Anticodon-binding domain-containing protein n=1 Tax=Tribonema minus TaxID=303371 RepID=A0A835YRS2_9STRA|nr:anticodon-binding domain-containing protein [Tribonema minus]